MNNLGIPAIVLSLLAAPFLAVSAGDLAERARQREANRTAELDYLAEARRPAAQQRLLQLAAAKAQSTDDPGSGARRLDATGAADHAPTFMRIVINASGTSIFEGLGSPGTDVTLNLGPRVIGTAKPDAAGQWRLLLDKPLEPGDHRITSSSKSHDQSRDLAGQDVRISIPEQFQGQAIVAYEAPAGPPPAIRDAQRQRAEALAKAASEKFSEVIPDTAAQPRLAQVPIQHPPPAAAKPAPAAQRPAPPAGDTGLTAPLTNWLERSAKDYQDLVVKGLSEPAGGAGSVPAPAAKPAPSAPRPAPSVKTTEQQPAEQSVSGPVSGLASDPLDALTDVQTAVQDWLARANREYQAEIMRRLETPAPGSLAVASGERPKSEPKPVEAAKTVPGPSTDEARAKAKADRTPSAPEDNERDGTQRAADARPISVAGKEQPLARAATQPAVDAGAVAEDAARSEAEDNARRQAEIKRQADEAVRKAADAKRAAEDAARKLAEDRQRRAEEITRQKNEEEAKEREAAAKKLGEQRAAAQKLVDDEARRAREAADRAAAERKAAEAQAREADVQRDAALKAAETARRLAAETDIKAAGEKRREAEAKAAEEQRKAAEKSRSAAAAQRAADERARAAEAASAEASKATAAAKAAELARQAVDAARSGPAKRAAERQLAEQTARARAAASRAVAAEKDGAAKAGKARTTVAKLPRPNDKRLAEGSAEKGPVDLPTGSREPLDRSERSGLGVGGPGGAANPAQAAAVVSRDGSPDRSQMKARSCARAGRRIGRPGTYVVQRGDTLWEIAERHYSNGERYRMIARVNSGRISDPDVIEPCLRLWLP